METSSDKSCIRTFALRVWVSEDEKIEIKDKANEASMSVSSYLRTVGLNKKIRSIYDLDAVKELVRINGDLGRVAGLFKMYLNSDWRDFNKERKELEGLIQMFRDMQSIMSDAMYRALR